MHFNTDGLVGTIDIGPRDSEDWRQCHVAMRADGFTAEYTCSVRDDELRHFLSQLENGIARIGQDVSFQTDRGVLHGDAAAVGRGGIVSDHHVRERKVGVSLVADAAAGCIGAVRIGH
jgi:hypothetical protein